MFHTIIHLLVLIPVQSLRLYDTQANQQRAKFDHKAAVLGACFSPSPNTIFSGGLDTWLRMCVYIEQLRYSGFLSCRQVGPSNRGMSGSEQPFAAHLKSLVPDRIECVSHAREDSTY